MAALLHCKLGALSLRHDPDTGAPLPDPNQTRPHVPSDLASFALGPKLGAGATASVFDASTKPAGGAAASPPIRVALKLVGQSPSARATASAHRAFVAEKRALALVDHPHVVRLHASNDQVEFDGKAARMLVLEHCPNGELYCVLEKLKALPEDVARTLALQLWRGLAACHAQDIAHRDIKPENVLMAEDWSLRLADFGFAVVGAGVTSTTSVGTPCYMSPEVLSGAVTYHPARADVWSAGVVTFLLLMGNPPVSAASTSCWFYRRLKNHEYREFWAAHEKHGPTLPQAAKDMLQRLLDPCARARPTAVDVLEDEPFMQGPELGQAELRAFLETRMRDR